MKSANHLRTIFFISCLECLLNFESAIHQSNERTSYIIPYSKIISPGCREMQDILLYVIGGFVRDILLNRDYQRISISSCSEAGSILPMRWPNSIGENIPVKYFKNFGTAMLKYEDCRSNSWVHGKNRTAVIPGNRSWRTAHLKMTRTAVISPSMRMAIDLGKDNYGELVDPFKGLHDLDKGSSGHPLIPISLFLTIRCG